MSGKNNVNPDHYKLAGRDKAGDYPPPRPARRGAPLSARPRASTPQATRRRRARRERS